MIEAGVEGGQVAVHHRLALAAVGVVDRGADARDRLLTRQHAAHREEAGLHHRVDVGPHAGLARHPGGVDHKHLQPALADRDAQPLGQPLPGLGQVVGAVEQEHPTDIDAGQQIEALHEIPLVAGHEGGPLDQVGGADRPRPEAQMRHRDRP